MDADEVERALAAAHAAMERLDAAVERATTSGDDDITVQQAREIGEEALLAVWRLILRIDGLDDEEVRAFTRGFMDSLRGRK